MNIAELKDRMAISDCLARCLQGLDQRDWPLFEGSFTKGALIEMPLYLPAPLSPQMFRDMLREKIDPKRYSGQHFLGNMLVEIEGDRAKSITEFTAVNLNRGSAPDTAIREALSGLYINELARGTIGWRIIRHVIALKSADSGDIRFPGPISGAILHTLARSASLMGHQDQNRSLPL